MVLSECLFYLWYRLDVFPLGYVDNGRSCYNLHVHPTQDRHQPDWLSFITTKTKM